MAQCVFMQNRHEEPVCDHFTIYGCNLKPVSTLGLVKEHTGKRKGFKAVSNKYKLSISFSIHINYCTSLTHTRYCVAVYLEKKARRPIQPSKYSPTMFHLSAFKCVHVSFRMSLNVVHEKSCESF